MQEELTREIPQIVQAAAARPASEEWGLLLSDFLGGAGGVLIAVPAVKDQVYRFHREAQARRQADSPWPGLREAARNAWEQRRNDYDGTDSLVSLLGALAITLSFLLKLSAGEPEGGVGAAAAEPRGLASLLGPCCLSSFGRAPERSVQ